MSHDAAAYGLWSLVIINSAVFILFAFSFAKPQSRRDSRSFGAFSAFLVALFAEMYGFTLTIYLLSGWLRQRFPHLDLFSRESGHLWHTLFGWQGDPHADPFHVASYLSIGGGFWLRFILIMLGFLLQWPTLVALVMFPVFVVMYVRLAHRDETEALAQFGTATRRTCGGRAVGFHDRCLAVGRGR